MNEAKDVTYCIFFLLFSSLSYTSSQTAVNNTKVYKSNTDNYVWIYVKLKRTFAKPSD